MGYPHQKQYGYDPTYWNGTSKFYKEYRTLHTELVPFMGKAQTRIGNLLRAMGNFYSDRYNNGHCNNKHAEAATMNRALKSFGFGKKYIRVKYSMLDSELDEVMDFLMEKIIERTSCKKD